MATRQQLLTNQARAAAGLPALTWSPCLAAVATAHAAENIHDVANRGGEVFMHNFNSKEGPIQIIQHQRIQVDADGNVRVDRTFERIGDC